MRLLNNASQDRDRKGRVADKKEPGEDSAAERETRRQCLVIKPERLKETRRYVTEMKSKQKKAEDVKSRYVIILEPIHHHRIDVVMSERIGLKQTKTGIRDAHCEMRDVVNDKRQHDQPAHHHVTRSERCFDVLTVDVGLRSRTAVFDRQLNGHVNVNADRH